MKIQCREDQPKNWKVICSDWMICSTYVSISDTASTGAAVFRDATDKIHGFFFTHLEATNPNLVEAQTLVFEAECAVKCKFKNILFYCDNEVVVTNFNGKMGRDTHCQLEGEIERFLHFAKMADSVKIKKINWNLNIMAHNC